MCATAANLIGHLLPRGVDLRQWVVTFPFSWRKRLANDGKLLGQLTRLVVDSVQRFYSERAAAQGAAGAKTGSVTAVQRTASDLRLSPHLYLVVLDGAYAEQEGELAFHSLGHLKTSEVGDVLERIVRRIDRHLRRHGLVESFESDEAHGETDDRLAASAVSGHTPPAGRQWKRGLVPLAPSALTFDKPLCASLDGFTLHAATRAGGVERRLEAAYTQLANRDGRVERTSSPRRGPS